MSKPKKVAIDAINHMLRRCQTDPDFAWHMMGTESFALCCVAAAEAAGRDASELRTFIEANVVEMQKKKKSRIEDLEIKLASESVTAATAENRRHSERNATEELFQQLNAMRDLIDYCRLRSESPTLDALEAAMDGKSLALCLGELG